MTALRTFLTKPDTVRFYAVIPVLVAYLFIAGALATVMDPIMATISSNILIATFIILWRYNYYAHHSNTTESTLRHNPNTTTFAHILTYIVGILFAWVGAHTLTQIYMYLSDSRSILGDMLADSKNTAQIISILTLVILVAPVCEEFVFRGFIQTVSQRIMPVWASITVSTLAFALIHGNGPQIIFAVLIGALFGYVYAYTQRIRNTIILHMTCNLAPFFLPIPSLVDSTMTTTTSAIIMSIISILAYALGVFIIYKATQQAQELKPRIYKNTIITPAIQKENHVG